MADLMAGAVPIGSNIDSNPGHYWTVTFHHQGLTDSQREAWALTGDLFSESRRFERVEDLDAFVGSLVRNSSVVRSVEVFMVEVRQVSFWEKQEG